MTDVIFCVCNELVKVRRDVQGIFAGHFQRYAKMGLQVWRNVIFTRLADGVLIEPVRN